MKRFAGCALALGLGACATTPPAPTPAMDAAAPAAPAAPVFLAGDLRGAAGADIDRLLGAPALTRREGPGEYRRYSLKDCVLVVILYPDDRGEQRAAHIEATAPISGVEKPDLDACLAAG